jgi:hypothetical protein
VSFERGQGLEEAAVPHMDGWRCYRMEINVEINKIVRISRQPSPKQIMYQKELENVEYFNYLGSTITNDARCTHEIKSRNAMAKAAVNNKRAFFTSKLDLDVRKKLVKCYILEHSFLWC